MGVAELLYAQVNRLEPRPLTLFRRALFPNILELMITNSSYILAKKVWVVNMFFLNRYINIIL